MKTHILLAGLLFFCGSIGNSHAQSLQQVEAHHAALASAAQRCQMALNQHLRQMQADAWQGRFSGPGPACANDMPALITQMRQDEVIMQRMVGNGGAAFCDTGICRNPNYGTESTGGGQAQAQFEQLMRNEETTQYGNVAPIGPGGPHHFNCGGRDVTAPGPLPPFGGCVEY